MLFSLTLVSLTFFFKIEYHDLKNYFIKKKKELFTNVLFGFFLEFVFLKFYDFLHTVSGF